MSESRRTGGNHYGSQLAVLRACEASYDPVVCLLRPPISRAERDTSVRSNYTARRPREFKGVSAGAAG